MTIYTMELKGETYTYTNREEAMINFEYEEMMGNHPILTEVERD